MRKSFSLLELLIALFLILLITGFIGLQGFGAFSEYKKRRALRELQSDLLFVRSYALVDKNDLTFSFYTKDKQLYYVIEVDHPLRLRTLKREKELFGFKGLIVDNQEKVRFKVLFLHSGIFELPHLLTFVPKKGKPFYLDLSLAGASRISRNKFFYYQENLAKPL